MKIYFTTEHLVFGFAVLVAILTLIFSKKIYKKKWLIVSIWLGLSILDCFFISTNDILGRICVDHQNNIYVAAEAMHSPNRYDFLLLKFNSIGTNLWSKQVNWFKHDSISITGFESDEFGSIYLAANKALLKIDRNGQKKWIQNVSMDIEKLQIHNGRVLLLGVDDEKRLLFKNYDYYGHLNNQFKFNQTVEFDYQKEPLCFDSNDDVIYYLKMKNLLLKLPPTV